MGAIRKRTFSLPGEQADYIDNLVSSGAYATSSEVIRAGLRALHQIFNKLREVNEDSVAEDEMRKGISEGSYKSPHLKLLVLSLILLDEVVKF